jgi:hypothetical protein
MSDFKVPGGEVSSVSFDPRLRFDDEVTEVTKTAGPPADFGQTISRQFGEDGAPAIKGGDSEWVSGSELATKVARDVEAKGLAEHARKFDAKVKRRKAQGKELDAKRAAEAKKGIKDRLAASTAARVRMMARVADSAKTNDKAKALRAGNHAPQASQGPSSSGPAEVAAPVSASAPAASDAGPVSAGSDAAPVADPSSK